MQDSFQRFVDIPESFIDKIDTNSIMFRSDFTFLWLNDKYLLVGNLNYVINSRGGAICNDIYRPITTEEINELYQFIIYNKKIPIYYEDVFKIRRIF